MSINNTSVDGATRATYALVLEELNKKFVTDLQTKIARIQEEIARVQERTARCREKERKIREVVGSLFIIAGFLDGNVRLD